MKICIQMKCKITMFYLLGAGPVLRKRSMCKEDAHAGKKTFVR
jgi:hypothetical protein